MWVWKIEVVGENGQVGDDNIRKLLKKKKNCKFYDGATVPG